VTVLPTPPPFMSACEPCSQLLDVLPIAFGDADLDPFYDGALRVQIALGRHLAEVHPESLPASHSDGCEACARFERLGSEGVFWREHLARDLFLPAELARLM
jgi:hypothetical protein